MIASACPTTILELNIFCPIKLTVADKNMVFPGIDMTTEVLVMHSGIVTVTFNAKFSSILTDGAIVWGSALHTMAHAREGAGTVVVTVGLTEYWRPEENETGELR